jgi:hypothetical protein
MNLEVGFQMGQSDEQAVWPELTDGLVLCPGQHIFKTFAQSAESLLVIRHPKI